MKRLEPALLGLFFASWVLALLAQVRLLPLAGALDLDLYPLFALAAALGWFFGNVYVHRRRRLPASLRRRRVFLIYLLGPPGVLYLARAMAPAADQRLAPLVPLLAFAVYAVFYFVPVSLAGEWSRPRDPR